MERHTKSYLRLIKPGITVSNTIATAAGSLLAASAVGFMPDNFIGVVVGVALVIASACVVNNILDRDIDAKMKRTSKRGLPAGSISVKPASAYAAALGVSGFLLLWFLTNPLTFWLGWLAYVWYVAVYGWAKRTTPYSTILGGVAGALPPAAGYTALVGSFDMAAWLLFAILFFWQIPHFYAIAMFRRDDYKKAGLPVWSVNYGLSQTKLQVFASVILYAVLAVLLFTYGYVGVVYLAGSSLISIYWIFTGIKLYKSGDDVRWARAMFGVSLLVLMAMCVLIAVGGYLP